MTDNRDQAGLGTACPACASATPCPAGSSEHCAHRAWPDPPADVMAWLRDTYDAEGVGLWLSQYRRSGFLKREWMLTLARSDGMGT